jgi:hypothetical protein
MTRATASGGDKLYYGKHKQVFVCLFEVEKAPCPPHQVKPGVPRRVLFFMADHDYSGLEVITAATDTA